jgi:hypothetical protein
MPNIVTVWTHWDRDLKRDLKRVHVADRSVTEWNRMEQVENCCLNGKNEVVDVAELRSSTAICRCMHRSMCSPGSGGRVYKRYRAAEIRPVKRFKEVCRNLVRTKSDTEQRAK